MYYENDYYENDEEDFGMSPEEIAEEQYSNDFYEREAFYYLTDGQFGEYDDYDDYSRNNLYDGIGF